MFSVEHLLKFTKGSLIESKLQSLKTATAPEASFQAVEDQTVMKNLANRLSREILLDWSEGGRKLSSFVPTQLKTIQGEHICHSSLIRVVRSRIFKTKDWKKFGRIELDELALRLMRKRGKEAKMKAWEKFGRIGLSYMTSRLMKKEASRIKNKGWKKFGRVWLDGLTLRLMKKKSELKNKNWKKFGRLRLNLLAMRLMRWDVFSELHSKWSRRGMVLPFVTFVPPLTSKKPSWFGRTRVRGRFELKAMIWK